MPIALLNDLLKNTNLNPKKMILLGIILYGNISSLFDPDSIRYVTLGTGEESIQASGSFFYWISILSLSSIVLLFYYCILIYKKSPKHKKKSIFLIIGATFYGPLALLSFITRLTKIIPGLVYVLLSIGALFISLYFYFSPDLINILLKSSKQVKIKRIQQLIDEVSFTKEELIIAQKKIQNQNKQLILTQKMDTIGKLTSGIAHDFNNIIQIIMGNIEVIQMDFNEKNPHFSYLTEIMKAGKQGAKICEQLLFYAQKTQTNSKLIDVNNLIRDIQNLIKSTIPPRISLSLELDSDVVFININDSELQQALMNLIFNSRDAIKNKGSIIIKAQNITISDDQKGDYPDLFPGVHANIQIIDSGCGIPESIKDHIFEPFYTTKKRGKGTGLGLFMIYNLVKKNHGCITFESTAGVGTIFNLFFPKNNQKN
jgi:signal transduction histidine kinase